MDRDEKKRERLRRATGRLENPAGREDGPVDKSDAGRDREGETGSEGRKGTIDRLIDQAQEKGLFDKAERFVRDKFGGRGGGSSRR